MRTNISEMTSGDGWAAGREPLLSLWGSVLLGLGAIAMLLALTT